MELRNKWEEFLSVALGCISVLVSGVNCLVRPPGTFAGNRCLLNPSLQIGFEGREFQCTERNESERERARKNICFDRRVD